MSQQGPTRTYDPSRKLDECSYKKRYEWERIL